MSEKIPNMDFDADEVIDDFKSKFKWPSSNEVEVVVKPPKVGLKFLISLLITLVAGAGVYYMMIPAMNFKSTDFYTFWFIIIASTIGAGNPKTILSAAVTNVLRSVVPNIALSKNCLKYLKPTHFPP